MNIIILDDHKLVATGIAKLLETIEKVSNTYVSTNSAELLKHCQENKPDMIFLDLALGNEDGRDVLTKIKFSYPDIPCFILSMVNEKHIIEDCIEKGATGFICKDCDFEDLQTVVNYPHDYFLSKEALRTLLGKSTKSTFKLQQSLTDKEKQFLFLLTEGYSPKEIAEQLHLSPRTIESHKTNIMTKFDVNSVSKLISLAIKHKVF
ncbi:MAG: response regulator transcription factor [Flavobacteriales bacterium]|nr:response regulator transcription factor [Flavobacteriales bacterium]